VKSLSGKEMCKALERRGWVLRRIKSSHHIYSHDDHPDALIVVPVHGSRSLRKGTQRGIMRDAGLTEDDL
jgi:predicted RNA binding protein YcfA (HicA-like mRNA interferase family)